jgi:hypothetical protein
VFLRQAFSLIFLCVGLSTAVVNIAWAAPVGFSFSGKVSFAADALPVGATPPPFGIYVPSSTPYSGSFYFDPNTAPVSAGTANDALIYPQLISGGFSATIGNLSVSASSYAVEVINDLPSGGSTFDEISIIFYNGLTASPPVAPIVVNGTAHAAAHFEIDLVGSSNLWSGPQLPSSLNLSDFNVRMMGSFDDESPPNLIDLLMTVTSLNPIPLLLGDMNRDGHVDAADVVAMTRALADPSAYETSYDLNDEDLLQLADLDGSGSIDNDDLQALVTRLSNSSEATQAAPEPNTFVLALAAAVGICVVGRSRFLHGSISLSI